MPQDTQMHPIYFDSEINGDFTDMGLPYRLVDADAGLDLMLTLHLAGVFQYRVVNGSLLQSSGETEGFLLRSVINSLPGVLADSEGSFGLPRELPTHAKEIGDALVSRLSWTWTDRFGVVLERFAITDCRLTEQSCALLERALATLHAPEALRERLGLQTKRETASKKAPGQQRDTRQTQDVRQAVHSASDDIHQAVHSASDEIQSAVSKLVSSWQAAVEKSRSSAIPSTPPGTQTGAAAKWRCPRCGRFNNGRFCGNCGARRVWVCPHCGRQSTGNYCGICGTKEP